MYIFLLYAALRLDYKSVKFELFYALVQVCNIEIYIGLEYYKTGLYTVLYLLGYKVICLFGF